MRRLIDADALIEFIENRYDITWKNDYEGGIKDACTDILEKISKMPTIEPEIIRCKDCKYWREHKYAKETKRYIPFCGFNAIYTKSDDFCSKAERRTDG